MTKALWHYSIASKSKANRLTIEERYSKKKSQVHHIHQRDAFKIRQTISEGNAMTKYLQAQMSM